jgi:predicted HicB family RNase H-like nuclease
MELSEKRKRNQESVKEYQKGRDAIMLRPSGEEGQTIRLAAKSAGQSVQAYVLQAIRERMERDQQTPDGDGYGVSDG